MSDQPSSNDYSRKPQPRKLRPGQLDCLRLLSMGLSNDEIAADLRISPRTVKTRISHSMKVLGVQTKAEAANFVYQLDTGMLLEAASVADMTVERAEKVQLAIENLLRSMEKSSPPAPPRWAVRLMSFIVPSDRVEAVLGDLEETFVSRSGRLGRYAAERWYKKQVLLACLAFGWRWVQRAAALEAVLRRIGIGL